MMIFLCDMVMVFLVRLIVMIIGSILGVRFMVMVIVNNSVLN